MQMPLHKGNQVMAIYLRRR